MKLFMIVGSVAKKYNELKSIWKTGIYIVIGNLLTSIEEYIESTLDCKQQRLLQNECNIKLDHGIASKYL